MPERPVAARRDFLKTASAAFGLGAFGPALGSRDVAAAEMAANEKALYEAAKQEGELTWYTAHSDDITAQALGRGFEATYPGIRVNVVRTTAQVAFQRVSQELRAGAMQVDVLSSTDIGSSNSCRRTPARCWRSISTTIPTDIISSPPRASSAWST